MNASKQYLDYLGLHGYYLVTKVQSKVTPSSFDVSIRALQEGISFDHQALQPSRVTVEEPSRPEDPPPEFFESQVIPEDIYRPPEVTTQSTLNTQLANAIATGGRRPPQ